MSLVILPDEVLDSQLCDNCHKYLSVKPVTVHSKKISCGRCKKKEDSVESVYNTLINNILFKCINRFDGCSKVLLADQVIEHEKTCKGNEYVCPGCPGNLSKIPSYMFPHHINEMHKNTFLKQNNFKVKLSNSEGNIYFYQKGNYLFFIDQKISEDGDYLVLDAFYIGGDEEFTVYQTYDVLLGNDHVRSQEKECIHLKHVHNGSATNHIYIGSEEANQKFLIVMFNFVTPYVLPNILSKQAVTTDRSLGIEWAVKSAVSYSTEACKNNCTYTYNLYTRGENGRYSVDGIKVAYQKITFSFLYNTQNMSKSVCYHCFMCKCEKAYWDLCITDIAEMSYTVCHFCSQLMSFESLMKVKEIVPKLSYDRIVWRKNNRFEKTCCFQDCSVKCTDFITLKSHFNETHQKNIYTSSHSLFENILELSGENYVFHDNIILCLTIEFIDQNYWLSLDIADKNCPRDYYAFCALYSHDKKLMGILFQSKMKVNLHEIKYATFIKFRQK